MLEVRGLEAGYGDVQVLSGLSLLVQEKEIVTTNGQVCGIDLPKALELLSTTDLARRIGYRVISLDALVEEGLVPLVEHRATAKVLVDI